jgi:hypothetical protein
MSKEISISIVSCPFSVRVICRSPHYLIHRHVGMAVPVQWYRESAKRCASRAEQSLNPTTKEAYRELVSAWLLLVGSAEQLARRLVVPLGARAENDEVCRGSRSPMTSVFLHNQDP